MNKPFACLCLSAEKYFHPGDLLNKERKKKFCVFFVLFCIEGALLLSVGGCKKSPILIGFAMNFSGPGGNMAVYVRDGALMAVRGINASGGVKGHPLELLVRNDEGTKKGIRKADLDLIKRGVIAVIGHRNAHDTLLAYPVVTGKGVLLVSPACASSKLTRRDDLFVRTTFIDDDIGGKIARFFKSHKLQEVLCVMDRANEAFSVDLFENIRVNFSGSLYPFFIDSKNDPTYPLLSNLAIMSHPRAILFITGPVVTALLAQRLRAMGCAADFFATTWAQTEDLFAYGGKAVAGMRVFTFVRPHNPYPPFRSFVKNLEESGLIPNIRNALGYEAVKLIAEGLARVKGITSRGLRDALIGHRFVGVINPLTLDKYGDPHRPLYLVGVRARGEMETLREVK